MSGNRLRLKGQRFGKLFVLREETKRRSEWHTYWRCACDCGTTYIARGANLVDGHTNQCKKCAVKQGVLTRQTESGSIVPAEQSFAMRVYIAAALHIGQGVKEMRDIMALAHDELTRV
jgi:hypothetical protein